MRVTLLISPVMPEIPESFIIVLVDIENLFRLQRIRSTTGGSAYPGQLQALLGCLQIIGKDFPLFLL
jgi:hypothetical protein